MLNHSQRHVLSVPYKGKWVEGAVNTKFFVCKFITTQIGRIIFINPKFSGAYYTVR